MENLNTPLSSFCLVLLDWQNNSSTFLNRAITTAALLSDEIYYAVIITHSFKYLPLPGKQSPSKKQIETESNQQVEQICGQLNINKALHYCGIFMGDEGIHQLNQVCLKKQITLIIKHLHPSLPFTQQFAAISPMQFIKETTISIWFITQPTPNQQALVCVNGEQHDAQHEQLTQKVIAVSGRLANRLSIKLELFHAITPLGAEWLVDTDLTQPHQEETQQLETNFDQLVSQLQNTLPADACSITCMQGEPGYVISQRLQQQMIDLLIIGWLPQNHWTHAIHGQLAERFIKQGSFDVIIIK
ncbi:universal stress protein [Spartinivicinus ruber]|uniref:universal stress protein n=1 Tax=Spartinivicinus ruber TaxID=2683272 RepID=UPI0013D1740C|nr:universal stress protein [Spartinivicinus ruber]